MRVVWTHSCIFEVLLRKTSLVEAFAERGGSSVSVLLTAASAAPMLPSTVIANMEHSNAEVRGAGPKSVYNFARHPRIRRELGRLPMRRPWRGPAGPPWTPRTPAISPVDAIGAARHASSEALHGSASFNGRGLAGLARPLTCEREELIDADGAASSCQPVSR